MFRVACPAWIWGICAWNEGGRRRTSVCLPCSTSGLSQHRNSGDGFTFLCSEGELGQCK